MGFQNLGLSGIPVDLSIRRLDQHFYRAIQNLSSVAANTCWKSGGIESHFSTQAADRLSLDGQRGVGRRHLVVKSQGRVQLPQAGLPPKLAVPSILQQLS